MNNICFATSVHHERYINQLKDRLLKSYLDLNVDIPFYVDTNLPELLVDYPDKVKVFNTDDIRDELSKELEPWNDRILYRTYEWGLRRFILKQAALDGYNIIIYTDADLQLYSNPNIKEDIFKLYSSRINVLHSPSYMWKYGEPSPPPRIFYQLPYLMEEYPEWNINLDTFTAVDGPAHYYMAKSPDDMIKFVDLWSDTVRIAKSKSYGDTNELISNHSIALVRAGFELKKSRSFHHIKHDINVRYK